MKRKIKEIVLLGISLSLIFMLGIKVYAASTNTFKASAVANTTTLKPGEEITITIGVSDINMGTNGINTLEGKIKYDENIFETIKNSSIQSLNNWTTTYNDESSTLNGKFLAVNLSSGIKENTQIFKVTLKAKQEIKNTTNTQIDFENITSNDGTDLINAGTKSINVTVNVENTNTTTPEKPNTNGDSGTNGSTTNSTNSKNETNKNTTIIDKTQASNKIPKTGKSIVIVFILLASVITFVGLGIKNKSMRDIK